MTSYNFSDSLVRIDERLNSNIDAAISPTIPRLDEIANHSTCRVYGTVVSIRYDCVSDETNERNNKKTLFITSFVSEVVVILRSNPSCRDVCVGSNGIIGVFNTVFRADLDNIIDDLARIRTLAMIVEKKAGLASHSIILKQGACYGEITMSVVDSVSNCKDLVWIGNAMDTAVNFSNRSECDAIIISRSIWKNLSDNNQKLFASVDLSDETYSGRIVNIVMNNWLSTN